MHVAGGLYRELCEVPHWDALFGSGGRGACAVLGLSKTITLCTYAKSSGKAESRFSDVPIRIEPHPSRTEIIFSYFHPLSDPHVEPPQTEIEQEEPIRVEAEVVLRFGMLEGDTIVKADTAVYDPQTRASPATFGANGSHAKRLAIVLNEGEIQALAHTPDVAAGAHDVLQTTHAEAVIVKRGVRGVLVVTRRGLEEVIPAYRTSHIFKIGTGDVFSGGFAAYWGEHGKSAAEAADLASRMVANYAAGATFPVGPIEAARAFPTGPACPIRILGRGNTLARRYVLEESKYCLEKLGSNSVTAEIVAKPVDALRPNEVALVIADGYPETALRNLSSSASSEHPIVLFSDDPEQALQWSDDSKVVVVRTDFTSSLYETMWIAMGASGS